MRSVERYEDLLGFELKLWVWLVLAMCSLYKRAYHLGLLT